MLRLLQSRTPFQALGAIGNFPQVPKEDDTFLGLRTLSLALFTTFSFAHVKPARIRGNLSGRLTDRHFCCSLDDMSTSGGERKTKKVKTAKRAAVVS